MPQISAAELEFHIANARTLRAQAYGAVFAKIAALFRAVPEQIAPAALNAPCKRTVIS
ncbi:MAG: hypothetical protein IBJ15_22995 [Alphaproteobacteria bacterium]|nr:hypothetical protein [Alphaproteobacteria bacterium]